MLWFYLCHLLWKLCCLLCCTHRLYNFLNSIINHRDLVIMEFFICLFKRYFLYYIHFLNSNGSDFVSLLASKICRINSLGNSGFLLMGNFCTSPQIDMRPCYCGNSLEKDFTLSISVFVSVFHKIG